MSHLLREKIEKLREEIQERREELQCLEKKAAEREGLKLEVYKRNEIRRQIERQLQLLEVKSVSIRMHKVYGIILQDSEEERIKLVKNLLEREQFIKTREEVKLLSRQLHLIKVKN
jgi:hypothetical protein